MRADPKTYGLRPRLWLLLVPSNLKVHLTPNFFPLKRIYLLFKILLRKKFWIRLNPRFSVLRRNLENSAKTPPFCFTTEFEENGSSSCCDFSPGRSNISRPLISFRMVQYTFEKCREMPSRSAISRYNNIPDLKKRYAVQFTGDDRSKVK